MMRAHAKTLLPALLLLLSLTARSSAPASPGTDEIKKKQSQLEQIRKEINKFESKIREKEKREHATLDLLDNYDRQANLLRRLLEKIKDRQAELSQAIDETRTSVSGLGGQLSYLKDQYARYARSVYKQGKDRDMELLLASRSVNQLYVRAEYLRRFTDQRRKDLSHIDSTRSDLQGKQRLLESELSEQQDLLREKQQEEKNLASKMKRRKVLLADIRRDKKNIKVEIDRKKASARELDQIIARLIDEDRARKEKNPRDATRDIVPPGTGFEARRGKLRWPVAGGRLASRFGSQENPTLHTITQNTGIDIAVPVGTGVEAVADGEVSKIYWLPSFGNLVILNHRNGYRTVYAHLSDISVAEGEKIREGGEIGKTGESVGGALFHFEIYKDREKQNPENWLRPRGVAQK
jgi:septal ring factor EnvC (AmiA/AmiB activator)